MLYLQTKYYYNYIQYNYNMGELLEKLLESHLLLFDERQKDIYFRGSTCLVYNMDGNVCLLHDALIWGDENGHYVKPKQVKRKKKYCCCW